MRVLGIDTSLTATGLALLDLEAIEDGDPLAAYTLDVVTVSAPKPTKDKSKRAMVRRVKALMNQIEGCFDNTEDRPDAVGIEGLAYGAKGEGVWVLPWIWGETIALCETYDVPLTVVSTSARAKYATGKGNAPKDAVLAAAVRLFSEAVDITNNNEADAAMVAAATAHRYGLPVLPVTAYRLEVLDKLGD